MPPEQAETEDCVLCKKWAQARACRARRMKRHGAHVTVRTQGMAGDVLGYLRWQSRA